MTDKTFTHGLAPKAEKLAEIGATEIRQCNSQPYPGSPNGVPSLSFKLNGEEHEVEGWRVYLFIEIYKMANGMKN